MFKIDGVDLLCTYLSRRTTCQFDLNDSHFFVRQKPSPKKWRIGCGDGGCHHWFPKSVNNDEEQMSHDPERKTDGYMKWRQKKEQWYEETISLDLFCAILLQMCLLQIWTEMISFFILFKSHLQNPSLQISTLKWQQLSGATRSAQHHRFHCTFLKITRATCWVAKILFLQVA